jgi:aminoacylase
MMQGFVMNMQPSEGEVGFDLRLPPTEDIEQIKRRIKEEWAPSHKNLTYQVKSVAFA